MMRKQALQHPNSLPSLLTYLVNVRDLQFKQWNADNLSCRSTTLAPTFGGPVNRLISLPGPDDTISEYVAYSTASRVRPHY